MEGPVNRKAISHFEIAAIVCFLMGFALYIAVDTGLVTIGNLGGFIVASSDELDPSALPTARFARIKALHKRIDFVESKMKEKSEILEKMTDEIQAFTERMSAERRSLNDVSNVVLEIEQSKSELTRETDRSLASGSIEFDATLGKIAKAARRDGIEDSHLGSIRRDRKDYLRLVNAFEFQNNGIYLRVNGLDRAETIADAVEDAKVREMTVVYRDDTKKPGLTRQRAQVLRAHFKELLGRGMKVNLARFDSERISRGAVEVWIGKK